MTPAGLANTIAAADGPCKHRHRRTLCPHSVAAYELYELGFATILENDEAGTHEINEAGIRRAERYLAMWQALEATECETFIIPHWSGEGDTLDSEKDCGKKTCRRCQALAQAAEKLQEALND